MIFGVGMRCLYIWPIPALMLFHACAWAQPRQDLSGLRAAAAQYVATQVTSAYPEARSEVSIGAIDNRLNLAACSKLGFAVPAGNNLWGSGNLRAHCAAPATWSLYLTYRIQLSGPALVAKRPLAAGERPGPNDAGISVTNYVGDPARYPKTHAEMRNANLTRPLAKGNPITIEMLRVPPIIRAGEKVRIIVDGSGFQITHEGIAQGQAGVGDILRLKTPSGRLVQGKVHADGSVRIQP
jgi:flagellar basal body P-ring formation protein FlgA